MNPEVFSAESIKLAVTIIGGLVAGGWAVLRLLTAYFTDAGHPFHGKAAG
jgi:hypothetical protein